MRLTIHNRRSFSLLSRIVTSATLLFGAVVAHAASTVTAQSIAADQYRISSSICKLTLEINPMIGARVTQLLFDGQSITRPYACNSSQYTPTSSCNGSGSTFWTSPQRAWPNGGWPPIVAQDGAAYAATIQNDHVVFKGPNDEALGASVDKDIAMDELHCVVDIKYTIHASHALKTAPWEITRVPRGGIALFPIGDKNKLSAAPLEPYINLSKDGRIVWFDDIRLGASPSKGGEKLIADGRGWLAYAFKNKLFIKLFADVPNDSLAPNEGDIEIYADKEFLELEAQGSYTSLTAGSALPWKVQWRVVAIPDSVKIEAGSESLLKLVEHEVSKLRQ